MDNNGPKMETQEEGKEEGKQAETAEERWNQ